MRFQTVASHTNQRRSMRSTVRFASTGTGFMTFDPHDRLFTSFASALRYVCNSSSERPAL